MNIKTGFAPFNLSVDQDYQQPILLFTLEEVFQRYCLSLQQ